MSPTSTFINLIEMARNFTANLFIDIDLKPGTMKKPCQWIETVVDKIFARKTFADHCPIDWAKKEVTCKDRINQKGNPIVYVSLQYLDFNISGDYETDYDKLLAKITDAIKKELRKVDAVGQIRFTGYDDDREPDISSVIRLGLKK